MNGRMRNRVVRRSQARKFKQTLKEAKFKANERKRSQQKQTLATSPSGVPQDGLEAGAAFGVRRGPCEAPCPCMAYLKTEDSYACHQCGHFPAQHADLGRMSDDDE